ncbi:MULTISPECIES: metallophosphoesterase family protein [unclassified Sinorhizobium]|uniref:metallophosphoesterase family protein n=1 Tax=unclassified Sinorhizobium TaxID=2613772 RepID=UPI00352311BF
MSFTFAIGDVHGCLDPLRRILAVIEAHAPSGRIVFLGDYVDRGPDSRGVIELLMAGPGPDWEWIALKGNHEDMMAGAHNGRAEPGWWLGNGGFETMRSYGGPVPEAHLEWMDALPLIYVDDHRIFAHAGVNESFPLDRQTEHDLLWIRRPQLYSGSYWGRHLCHGHTPELDNPFTVGNRTNIDSGCAFGGTLSCAVFDDQKPGGPIEFLQVPA